MGEKERGIISQNVWKFKKGQEKPILNVAVFCSKVKQASILFKGHEIIGSYSLRLMHVEVMHRGIWRPFCRLSQAEADPYFC